MKINHRMADEFRRDINSRRWNYDDDDGFTEFVHLKLIEIIDALEAAEKERDDLKSTFDSLSDKY